MSRISASGTRASTIPVRRPSRVQNGPQLQRATGGISVGQSQKRCSHLPISYPFAEDPVPIFLRSPGWSKWRRYAGAMLAHQPMSFRLETERLTLRPWAESDVLAARWAAHLHLGP